MGFDAYLMWLSLIGEVSSCRHAKEEAEKKEREERQKRQEELRHKRKVKAQQCKRFLQLSCMPTLHCLRMHC